MSTTAPGKTVHLQQKFGVRLNEDSSPLHETSGIIWKHFWLSQLGRGVYYRPGMLLNTLLCTRRPPTDPHNKGLFSDQVSVALKTRISGLNESVPSRILAHCGKAHISSKIVISSQNFHKNKRRILVHMYPYD